MPTPFALIPEHLKIEIAEKQEAADFIQFHEASRESYNIAKKIKSRITYEWERFEIGARATGVYVLSKGVTESNVLENLPIRLTGHQIFVNSSLTDIVCDWLINFITCSQCCYEHLALRKAKCSLERFNRLLEISNVSRLCAFIWPIPFKFLQVANISKLESLSVSCFLNNDELSHMKLPAMSLIDTNVSSFGVRQFINEWINGQRRITYVFLSFENDKNIDEDVILDGIDAEFIESWNNELDDVYSVRKDNGDEIIIKVESDFVEMRDAKADVSKYE